MGSKAWYGFDLDGTIAKYSVWKGAHHIGVPLHPAIDYLKAMLKDGKRIKIFTARVNSKLSSEERQEAEAAIKEWCLEYIGQELEVTAEKDIGLIEFFDDRAIRVICNEGRIEFPKEYERPIL